MKGKSSEELLTLVAIGLVGRRAPSAVYARDANAELARRLRAVVPLLEDLQRRGDATGQEWAVELAKKGLALVKGTAEAATGGEGTET